MGKLVSEADRNVHIESVIKSNIITFGLSTDDIDCITKNLTADIIDVLDNFRDTHLQHQLQMEDENKCG